MTGIFLERPNRFIGNLKHKGKVETAHIHDLGGLKELLIKGVEVLFNIKLTYENHYYKRLSD